MRHPGRVGALLVAAALTLPACSSGAADGSTLTVSAAASLTEAFTDLAATFEEEHPDVTVSLNFAGSSALAEQVNAGAPVDVLATASATTMATAADAGSVVDPKAFAANRLTIVVPAGNPSGVTSLADLAAVDVRTAICAAEVPCGAATDELLRRDGIQVNAVTLDPDVKSVLGRVAAGEVDAGIVYVTDASAAGSDVEPVPLPDDGNVSTDYLIARVAESGQPELAADFIDLVTGPTGQRTLADRGFAVR